MSASAASRLLVLAVIAVLTAGVATADVSEDDLHINQVAATDQASGGTGFTLNQLFSTISGDTLTVQPGEENVFYSFDIDLTQTVDDGRLVVELNRCDDSVDYNLLTRDDCNDNVFSTVVEEDVSGATGDTVNGWASIDFPQASGNYEVVGYVADAEWRLVSDAPHLFVTVEEPDNTGGGGGGDGGATVDVVQVRDPQVSVNGNTVTGMVEFQNIGTGDMQGSRIVEMQVQPAGQGPLSTFVGGQRVCDPAHPENVHREFQLNAGDSRTISLSTQVEPGQEYDVFFVTANACSKDTTNFEHLAPYRSAAPATATVCVGSCDQGKLPVLPLAFLATVVGGFLVIRYR